MKENKRIDQIAKDALEHYEMPFEPAHWDLMESRLRAQRTPHRASVIVIKSIELLLMTVALTSLLHYANTDTNAEYTATQPAIATVERPLAQTIVTNTTEINSHNTAQSTALNLQPINTIHNTSTQRTNAEPTANLQQTKSIITNKPATNALQTHNPQSSKQSSVPITNSLPDDEHIIVEAAPSIVHDGNIKTNTPQNALMAKPSSLGQPQGTTPTNVQSTNNQLNTQRIHNEQSTNNQLNTPQTRNEPTTNQTNLPMQMLPSLPMQPLSVPSPELNISLANGMPIADTGSDTPYETATLLRRHPILKGSAGYEISTISQFSREGIQSASAKSNRFGLGIVFNIFKKISFETALELTHKNYQTANELQAFANSNSNQVVQNTAMLLAEIPLSANINVVQNKKYSFYIKAGARFSNLLTAQYIWRNGADATYTTYNTSLTSNSRINSDQVEEITNSTNFWSLGGGLGLSYHLSPRVSVFAEPSIYHALNGIGQRKDFINSIGLGLGASCIL